MQHKNINKKIALTFDDGPHYKYTEQILDILKEYDVPATFFVVGENVKRFPELLKREIDEGHEIGNHTYGHPSLKKITDLTLINEILKAERSIYDLTEYKTKLFRPPEGQCNDKIVLICEKMDYNVILWTIDTMDWNHNPVNKIVDTVINNIKSGDIILFHDFISKISPTPDSLRIIIPKLKDLGYQFVTVSELIMSN